MTSEDISLLIVYVTFSVSSPFAAITSIVIGIVTGFVVILVVKKYTGNLTQGPYYIDGGVEGVHSNSHFGP